MVDCILPSIDCPVLSREEEGRVLYGKRPTEGGLERVITEELGELMREEKTLGKALMGRGGVAVVVAEARVYDDVWAKDA